MHQTRDFLLRLAIAAIWLVSVQVVGGWIIEVLTDSGDRTWYTTMVPLFIGIFGGAMYLQRGWPRSRAQ